MEIQKRNIDLIKPYWRNPRKNEKAVESVKESIKQYGYTQPIVVDKENVIIAGHTRYKALRQLGYEEIAVVLLDVDEDKARQYRIADNKTAEKAEWDDDLLTFELRGIEELGDMTEFFNSGELDVLLDIQNESLEGVTNDDYEEEIKRAEMEEEAKTKVVAKMGGVSYEDSDMEEQKEIDKKVKEKVDEDMKAEIREAMQKDNEKIKKRELEMKNRFVEASEDKEDDYIEIECPHCDEKYILSRAELLRAKSV